MFWAGSGSVVASDSTVWLGCFFYRRQDYCGGTVSRWDAVGLRISRGLECTRRISAVMLAIDNVTLRLQGRHPDRHFDNIARCVVQVKL